MLIQKLHFIIFLTFSIVFFTRIIRNIFFTEYYTKKYITETSGLSDYNEFLSRLPLFFYTILCFIFAYFYGDYSLIWLVLFIIYLLHFIVGFIAFYISKNTNMEKPGLDEKYIKREKKFRRLSGIYETFILIFWIFSWRHLFI